MGTKKSGTLWLIPTPISREYSISKENLALLKLAEENEHLILVEDLKPSRQRWTSWGLNRETIPSFICYNEQTWEKTCEEVLSKIKNGKDAVMFSDGGLPVIADPGRQLVFSLRQNNCPVISGPFDNSFLLGLALSGFHNDSFHYLGFPPREKDSRKDFFKSLNKRKETLIIMDTAYRLDRVQDELLENVDHGRLCFIGCELTTKQETHFWGPVGELGKNRIKGKQNFILCLNAL